MRTILLLAALLLAGPLRAGDILADTPDHEWAQMRLSMPSYDQDRFFKKHGCTPNSLANGLLWWHSLGIVDLAKARRSKRDTLEEVAHDLSASILGTNRSGATNTVRMDQRIIQGVGDILNPGYQLAGKQYYMPELLERIDGETQRANLCILSVTSKNKKRHKSTGHSILLCQADRSGGLVFHTWGQVFRYRLPADQRPSRKGLLLVPVGEGCLTHDFSLDSGARLTVIEVTSPGYAGGGTTSAQQDEIARLQAEIFDENGAARIKKGMMFLANGDVRLEDGTIVPNPKRKAPRR
jgi:hypothetical protein